MKYLSYLKIGLLLLGVVVAILLFTTGDKATNDYPYLSMALTIAYVFMGLTVFLAVVMPLTGIVQNPKGALKSLVGLGLVAVVVFIAYAMSSSEAVTLSNGTIVDKESTLRFTDTALYTTFFAFAGVLLAIVGSELYRIFK